MNRSWSHHGFAAALLVGVVVLGACGQRRPASSAQPAASAGGYLAAPTLTTAGREADGGVHLIGQAPPDARIALRSPDGSRFEAHSGPTGAWSLDIPAAPAPRLFAFEAATASQTVRGEGAMAVMPDPGVPALILRAGYAAAPSGKPPSGLQLVSFDCDGGGAAAGGFAPPGSPVRMSIDGAIVGLSKADAQGRFAILAIDPRRGVPAGRHTLRIDTPQSLAIERQIEVKAPDIAPDKAFDASRIDGGWTLSWRLPGGGAQSSMVFDSASATAGAAR
jgi:hypothetical protein